MKHFKTLCLVFFAFVLISCGKDDDSVDNPADNAQFNATINGGTFSNYSSTLGFYIAQPGISENTLSINVTDSNNNVINMFMNSTNGLGNGTIKEIGDVDTNGFSTTVAIRDQVAQITYTSISGSITITDSRVNPADSEYRLISGSFDIVASINTGTQVTMTGTFSNLQYSN
ncbi:MAG: hypothetical protein R2783_08310 [Gelidibacter sp.]